MKSDITHYKTIASVQPLALLLLAAMGPQALAKPPVVTGTLVHLRRATVNIPHGWSSKSAVYGPISVIYLARSNTATFQHIRNVESKIVRLQAPPGIDPNKAVLSASAARKLILEIHHDDGDTKVNFISHTISWRGIPGRDKLLEFTTKHGENYVQFERSVVSGQSTYQVYDLFKKSHKFTAADMTLVGTEWRDLLANIVVQ